MRKTFKKTVLPILLSVTASLLLSCGEKAPVSATTEVATQSETTTTEAAQLKPDLPEKDNEGYTFLMLIRNSDRWVGDMYSDGENGELINDAIYRRNDYVAEKYNISFEVIRSTNDVYETDAMKSILAGEDAYDLVIPHARAIYDYARVKTLLDWSTDLPYVVLTSLGGMLTHVLIYQ